MLVSTRLTRRKCRVVSRRDEPSGIWAILQFMQRLDVSLCAFAINDDGADTLSSAIFEILDPPLTE